MNSWKVILATLVIFGAGVVTGGLLVNYTVRVNARPRPMQGPQIGNLTPWQLRSRELVRRMEQNLALSPEQRTNIERILIDSQERTRGLWRPIVPQMNREMQQVHGQIRAELNPDQQKKFDELLRPRPQKKADGGPAPDRRNLEQRRPADAQTPEAPATNSVPAAN